MEFILLVWCQFLQILLQQCCGFDLINNCDCTTNQNVYKIKNCAHEIEGLAMHLVQQQSNKAFNYLSISALSETKIKRVPFTTF